MRLLTKAMGLAVLAAAMVGCGSLEVYTDPGMKGEETGFKFYTPKPYLLVGRGPADKPIEISVKYLPDLDRPLYAKARPGWLGSTSLAMVFSESGAMTSFNQTTDTKANEMVTALGGFLTSLAAFNKSSSPAGSLQPANNPDIAKILPELKQAASELRAQSNDDALRAGHVTGDEAKKLNLYAATVDVAVRYLESQRPGSAAPFAAALLRGVSDAIGAPASDRGIARQGIVMARARIDSALARLSIPLPGEGFFALYEIVMKDGVTTLVEVTLPKPKS